MVPLFLGERFEGRFNDLDALVDEGPPGVELEALTRAWKTCAARNEEK